MTHGEGRRAARRRSGVDRRQAELQRRSPSTLSATLSIGWCPPPPPSLPLAPPPPRPLSTPPQGVTNTACRQPPPLIGSHLLPLFPPHHHRALALSLLSLKSQGIITPQLHNSPPPAESLKDVGGGVKQRRAATAPGTADGTLSESKGLVHPLKPAARYTILSPIPSPMCPEQ